MKKLLCVIFAVCMLFTTVYAQDGYDLTQATLDAKTKVEIPAECTEFSSYVRNETDLTIYTLMWMTPDDAEVHKSVEVEISDRGDLLSYYSYSEEDVRQTGISDISIDELTKIAAEFVERVNPSWVSQLDFDAEQSQPSIYDPYMYVRFPRVMGGIEVYGNYFTVTLDKFTGKVTGANSNWTYTGNGPTICSVLEESAAQEKFIDLSGLNISYRTKPDTKNAILVYTPGNASLWLDATSGDEAVRNFYYHAYSTAAADNMKEMDTEVGGSGGGAASLTPVEIEEIERMDSLISKEDAGAFAIGLENGPFKNATVRSVSYNVYKKKDAPDLYTATVTMADEFGSSIIGSVRLNAETGELIALNYYRDFGKEDAEKLPEDILKKTADGFKDKYAADIKDELAEFAENSNGTYLYERSVNGIRFGGHYVRVHVDVYTNVVTSFSRAFTDDIVFDSPEGIIGEEAAAAALFSQNPLKLMHADLTGESVPNYFRYIYALTLNENIIDAKTGKLLSHDLSEYTGVDKRTVMPDDLDGHWAKDIVNTLISNGVFALDEGQTAFLPDNTLTQAEALELVAELSGMYLPRPLKVDDLYTRIINRDVLDKDEKNPDAVVTREEAVKYIVRALGHRDVAELAGIYDSGFSDRGQITQGYEGYVALAKGLSIVSGDGLGNFSPKAEVTRAEFAAMMYNYLTRG